MADDEEFKAAQGVDRQRSSSTDALRLLPHLEWRGIIYPVSARAMSFRHEQMEHKFQYRGNDFVEPLGPHSRLFRYTFPMRQDIARGPYAGLFNEGLPRLALDMYDRTPGELKDPVYGIFRCVPVSFDETLDVNKRDGVDVQVEFLHSPEFDSFDTPIENVTSIDGLTSNAGAMDAELTKVDWKQEPSPQGLTDVLSAINGIGRKGLRQVDRFASRIDDLAFRLQKIEETADEANNPDNWQLRDSARNLRYALTKVKNRLTENPLEKTRRINLTFARSISVIAAENGMTLEKFMSLNPQLKRLRGPMVPKGTKVTVTARGKP